MQGVPGAKGGGIRRVAPAVRCGVAGPLDAPRRGRGRSQPKAEGSTSAPRPPRPRRLRFHGSPAAATRKADTGSPSRHRRAPSSARRRPMFGIVRTIRIPDLGRAESRLASVLGAQVECGCRASQALRHLDTLEIRPCTHAPRASSEEIGQEWIAPGDAQRGREAADEQRHAACDGVVGAETGERPAEQSGQRRHAERRAQTEQRHVGHPGGRGRQRRRARARSARRCRPGRAPRRRGADARERPAADVQVRRTPHGGGRSVRGGERGPSGPCRAANAIARMPRPTSINATPTRTDRPPPAASPREGRPAPRRR